MSDVAAPTSFAYVSLDILRIICDYLPSIDVVRLHGTNCRLLQSKLGSSACIPHVTYYLRKQSEVPHHWKSFLRLHRGLNSLEIKTADETNKEEFDSPRSSSSGEVGPPLTLDILRYVNGVTLQVLNLNLSMLPASLRSFLALIPFSKRFPHLRSLSIGHLHTRGSPSISVEAILRGALQGLAQLEEFALSSEFHFSLLDVLPSSITSLYLPRIERYLDWDQEFSNAVVLTALERRLPKLKKLTMGWLRFQERVAGISYANVVRNSHGRLVSLAGDVQSPSIFRDDEEEVRSPSAASTSAASSSSPPTNIISTNLESLTLHFMRPQANQMPQRIDSATLTSLSLAGTVVTSGLPFMHNLPESLLNLSLGTEKGALSSKITVSSTIFSSLPRNLLSLRLGTGLVVEPDQNHIPDWGLLTVLPPSLTLLEVLARIELRTFAVLPHTLETLRIHAPPSGSRQLPQNGSTAVVDAPLPPQLTDLRLTHFAQSPVIIKYLPRSLRRLHLAIENQNWNDKHVNQLSSAVPLAQHVKLQGSVSLLPTLRDPLSSSFDLALYASSALSLPPHQHISLSWAYPATAPLPVPQNDTITSIVAKATLDLEYHLPAVIQVLPHLPSLTHLELSFERGNSEVFNIALLAHLPQLAHLHLRELGITNFSFDTLPRTLLTCQILTREGSERTTAVPSTGRTLLARLQGAAHTVVQLARQPDYVTLAAPSGFNPIAPPVASRMHGSRSPPRRYTPPHLRDFIENHAPSRPSTLTASSSDANSSSASTLSENSIPPSLTHLEFSWLGLAPADVPFLPRTLTYLQFHSREWTDVDVKRLIDHVGPKLTHLNITPSVQVTGALFAENTATLDWASITRLTHDALKPATFQIKFADAFVMPPQLMSFSLTTLDKPKESPIKETRGALLRRRLQRKSEESSHNPLSMHQLVAPLPLTLTHLNLDAASEILLDYPLPLPPSLLTLHLSQVSCTQMEPFKYLPKSLTDLKLTSSSEIACGLHAVSQLPRKLKNLELLTFLLFPAAIPSIPTSIQHLVIGGGPTWKDTDVMALKAHIQPEATLLVNKALLTGTLLPPSLTRLSSADIERETSLALGPQVSSHWDFFQTLSLPPNVSSLDLLPSEPASETTLSRSIDSLANLNWKSSISGMPNLTELSIRFPNLSTQAILQLPSSLHSLSIQYSSPHMTDMWFWSALPRALISLRLQLQKKDNRVWRETALAHHLDGLPAGLEVLDAPNINLNALCSANIPLTLRVLSVNHIAALESFKLACPFITQLSVAQTIFMDLDAGPIAPPKRAAMQWLDSDEEVEIMSDSEDDLDDLDDLDALI